MLCTGSVYYVPLTCDSAPPPGFSGRGAVDGSVAGTLGLAGALGLEVRDGLLDLGLVLRLAGLLDHLGGDPGRHELLDHSHVRLLVVGCRLSARLHHEPTVAGVPWPDERGRTSMAGRAWPDE